MDIRDRECVMETLDELRLFRLFATRLRKTLKRNGDRISGSLSELAGAMDRVADAVDDFEILVDGVIAETKTKKREPSDYTPDETQRLQQLNHSMNTFSRLMNETAGLIRPAMQAKLDDDTDPLWDFEIEAKIDYQLRDDDPEYDENSDNYISRRSESLAIAHENDKITQDWRCGLTPEPFKAEPLSWLLHDLTEHGFGLESPAVRPRECLRIGTVFLDIQVWWQYAFDMDSGKWIKRYRKPDYELEFVKTSLV